VRARDRRSASQGKEELSRHFPIFSREDFDFCLDHSPYPIGLKSTYPEELVRRVAAALVSFRAGNSGIDYTYKRYLKEHKYELDDGSRLDLRISREIKSSMHLLDALIFQTTAVEGKRRGEVVAEWTFLRIPFAVKSLLSSAHQGALFESVAIARMILEQIAWATKIDAYESDKDIQNTSSTKSISALSKYCCCAGPLYGWLSDHAHWAYEAHVKAWRVEEGELSTLLATSEFKAKVLALTILTAAVAIRTFVRLKEECIEKVFQRTQGVPPALVENQNRWKRLPEPTIDALKQFVTSTTLTKLMSELLATCPTDSDITALAGFMTTEN
jgi:hypothetical protein